MAAPMIKRALGCMSTNLPSFGAGVLARGVI
jgi:hypothetical protein